MGAGHPSHGSSGLLRVNEKKTKKTEKTKREKEKEKKLDIDLIGKKAAVHGLEKSGPPFVNDGWVK